MRYLLFNLETSKVLAAGFLTQEQANDYALENYSGDLFPVVVMSYNFIEP
jgi:hypothetical protein